MAKTVSFGMVWQAYGRQTIALPDEIDGNDREAVIQYIKSVWDDIPIPVPGMYLYETDELDEESIIKVHDDREE